MIRSLLTCVLLASSAPALALAPAKPKPAQPATAQTATPAPGPPQAMNKADMLKQVDAKFASIDTNGDHSITADELAALQARSLASAQAAMQKQMEDDFKKLDTNGDGALSLAEFRAAAPTLRPRQTPDQMLKAMDANGDGKVTDAEYRAGPVADFDRMDADHNGILTAQEVQAAARAARPR